MKIIKTAILTIAAAVLSLSGGVAVASDANGIYAIYGTSEYSCAKLLEQYRNKHRFYSDARWWVGGWVSAAGKYNDTKKSFLDIADIDGIMHLIRDYCDENPLDSLTGAADYVVGVHLLPKAGYR